MSLSSKSGSLKILREKFQKPESYKRSLHKRVCEVSWRFDFEVEKVRFAVVVFTRLASACGNVICVLDVTAHGPLSYLNYGPQVRRINAK